MLGGCARAATPVEAPAPVPQTTVPQTSPPAAAPAASALAPIAPGDTLVREYRGAYTRGFEASWFAPCDAPMDDALWWVTLTPDALRQRDSLLKALTSPPTSALAVRWRGTASPRMQAGHMGRGTRYFLVTQVLEVRPLPPEGACMPTARAS
jgi:hypothetical protein